MGGWQGSCGRDRTGAAFDIRARYVVGADGVRSRIARSVAAAVSEVGAADGAAQYAYYSGIPWTGIELYVAPGSFAGVFPTHDGEACIWVCNPATDAAEVRRRTSSRVDAFDELLGRTAPQLFERLRQARRTSPVRGMLRQPNQLRQAFGPGWALVGDAGYHRDAVTACGISDAFRDAELLAVALDRALRGDPDEPPRSAATSSSAIERSRTSSRSPAPGGLSARPDLHRTAEAAGRRHRRGGRGAGRSAGPRRPPGRDRLTTRRPGRRRCSDSDGLDTRPPQITRYQEMQHHDDHQR